MDKRWITGLLAAISLALVGLVVIQVYSIRSTIALKEVEFTQSVGNALHAVSDRLEQAEKMGDLKRHRAGRRLLMKLDAMRRESTQPEVRAEVERMNVLVNPDSEGVVQLPEAPAPTEEPNATIADQEPAPPAWDPVEHEEHEALVTDMVRGITAQGVGARHTSSGSIRSCLIRYSVRSWKLTG